jgi:rhomboid family protein
MMTQTLMTLAFGTAAGASVPNLGASGAIAAVLGAYLVLYPGSTVRGLFVFWPVQVAALFPGRSGFPPDPQARRRRSERR